MPTSSGWPACRPVTTPRSSCGRCRWGPTSFTPRHEIHRAGRRDAVCAVRHHHVRGGWVEERVKRPLPLACARLWRQDRPEAPHDAPGRQQPAGPACHVHRVDVVRYLDVKINRVPAEGAGCGQREQLRCQGDAGGGGESYEIYRLVARSRAARPCPYSLKVLLENLLRTEDGANITADHIRALGGWDPSAEPDTEIQFTPARVIMQDFTGVPCVVDLATMREAVAELGGDPAKINPLAPGRAGHRPLRDRRRVRHAPTPSSATSRSSTSATASATSSCAGARPRSTTSRSSRRAPASCTRSTSSTWPAPSWSAGRRRRPTPTPASAPTRTPRWSTASACSAGASAASRPRRPCSASPSRCSSRASSASSSPASIPPGATATDVVLTITEMLRKHGVVGKFVEFYGEGVAAVPLANRATIGNMSPEFGSTVRDLPDRRRDPRLPAPHRPLRASRSRSSRRTPRSRACGTTRTSRAALLRVPRARPVHRRAVASPARSARRTASRSPTPRTPFRKALPTYVDARTRATPDEAGESSRPATRRRPRRHRRADGGDEPPTDGTGPTGRRSPVTVTAADGTTFEIDHGAVVDRRDHLAAPTPPTRR